MEKQAAHSLHLAPISFGTGAANAQRGMGIYLVTDPAYYSGGSDIVAAANAAIADMPSSGGTLYIPRGDWTVSAPIVLKANMRLQGAGRRGTRVTATGGGLFVWTATLSNTHIEHLYLASNSGHIFSPSGGDRGIYNVSVRHCIIAQNDPNSSIMYHVSALDYDNVVFEDCDMNRPGAATVPAFYIVNSGGAANENRWLRCWAKSNNCTSTPFFLLESATDENYAYDNRFEDITGEQNPGGLIRALSTYNLVVDNVADYDSTTPYVADVIYVGKSGIAGGLRSKYPVVRNCGRRGGTLGAGVYDINMPTGAVSYGKIEQPNHSSTSGLLINISAAGSDGTIVIGAPKGSIHGPASIGSDVSSYFGLPAVFAGGLYSGSAPVISPLSIQALAGGGEACGDRRLVAASGTAGASGQLLLTYFTAGISETIGNVAAYTTAASATNTPTLIRVGIFAVDGSGNLTLVASTANDTTLFADTSTRYLKALSAPWSKVSGTLYAVGILFTGTTAPTYMGFTPSSSGLVDSIWASGPRLSGKASGLTDLPDTVASTSIVNTRINPYLEFLP